MRQGFFITKPDGDKGKSRSPDFRFQASIHPSQVEEWKKAYALSSRTIQNCLPLFQSYLFATRAVQQHSNRSLRSCASMREQLRRLLSKLEDMSFMEKDLLKALAHARKTGQKDFILGLTSELEELDKKACQVDLELTSISDDMQELANSQVKARKVTSEYANAIYNQFF